MTTPAGAEARCVTCGRDGDARCTVDGLILHQLLPRPCGHHPFVPAPASVTAAAVEAARLLAWDWMNLGASGDVNKQAAMDELEAFEAAVRADALYGTDGSQRRLAIQWQARAERAEAALTNITRQESARYQGSAINERDLFMALADWWHEATDQLPPAHKSEHAAYQRIRNLGTPMLPFILEDLRDRGGDWFRLLRALADANPVPPEQQGNRQQMKAAWLKWGLEKQYIA